MDNLPPAADQSFLRKQSTALLSGLGYYRLSVRRRKLLGYLFLSSLGVHLVGLLVFGGVTVMRSRKEEVTIFKTPPPARTYEPRKLEHRVKLQKQQRSSSRPAMVPRMVAMKLSQLALPDIKMDPKLIHTTFQPKFKAVSGKGLGAGLGTGYGTHGFGLGVSTLNFFGIQARGEKIAILVDVSVSMVEEERGGVTGYMRVKRRIEEVIDALAEGSLFSVIVFADAAKTMQEKMLVATEPNKKDARLFIRPFNTEGNWGLTHGNLQSSTKGLKAHGGTTRLDLALTGAFQQGADTILIISDGAPRVRKGYTAEQLAAWNQRQANWHNENAAAISAYDSAPTTEEKVWVPPQPARPARPPSKRPPKEGQAPDLGSPAQPARPGYWRVVHHRTGGHRPQPPQIPDPGFWTLTDFIEHLKLLHETMYLEKGKKPPVVHCIGYQIDKDGHAFLSTLARTYHGHYRRVSALR